MARVHHAAQTAAMDAVVALLQVEYVTKKIGVRGVQRNEVLTSRFLGQDSSLVKSHIFSLFIYVAYHVVVGEKTPVLGS